MSLPSDRPLTTAKQSHVGLDYIIKIIPTEEGGGGIPVWHERGGKTH